MKTLTTFLTVATLAILTVLPGNLQAREARWEPAMKRFDAQDAKTSPPKDGILFVGSSSIVGWKVDKFFPELPVINRGFGGSKVSDVVDYFDRVVTPYEPETIVFYSGDNDIAAGKTTTTVINDVKKFVSMVHETLPDTRIILLPPKPSISRWKLYPEMKQVGELEKQLADKDPKVEFVDIATPMLGPDGTPKPELFLEDKLHMTEEGYVIWSDLVRPLLEKKPETKEFTWEKNPRWQTNMDKFAAEDAKTSPPKDVILFIGSSSIVRWDLKKYFPDLPVLNRGFGGSRFTDLIDYFDQVVVPYAPKTVVIYSGDNDLNGHHTPEIVMGNVKRLIGMIHDRFPDARVVLIPPKASISRWRLFPKMREVAEAQKALAESSDKIDYVDTSAPMLGPDGKPLPEMFIEDKLHLTHEAYVIWADLLRPYIDGSKE